VLTGCRFVLPLQVLAPVTLDDPAAVVSLLNPTGGVLGGDRLVSDLVLGEGAHAVVTTPSATRIYRTAGEPAVQTVRLRLGPGSIMEWVPDHTIPSAGAALRQSFDVEVEDGARLILIDAFAAGRVARGEAWRFALLDSALTVRDTRGLLLHDRFVLRGGGDWDRLGRAEGRPYFATIVLVADTGLDSLIADLPGALPDRAAAVMGVARLPRRGALVRCLAGDAPSLSEALHTVWTVARARLLGLSPLSLRKL
jgi:urease accessory protein